MPPKKDALAAPIKEDLAYDANRDQTVTMPADYLTSLMSQLQQAHMDMCEKLITSVTPARQQGSFADCKHSFSGTEDSVEDAVEAFIDAVQTYKDCTGVSDQNALRGLSMLFTDLAATWWIGIKSSVDSWDSALTCLRNSFGKKQPAYRIFRELFRCEQGDEKTDIFICKCRALISKLPYSLQENVQVDMVYGLLNCRIRKRISRDDIHSFTDLSNRSRSVEDSIAESLNFEVNKNAPSFSNICDKNSNKISNNRPVREESRSNVPSKSFNDNKQSRFCGYCKMYGHLKDNCKKLSKRAEPKQNVVNDQTVSNEVTTPKFSCYGCGNPGVVRSNCPRCKSGEAGQSAAFSAFAATSAARRPLVTDDSGPPNDTHHNTNTPHIHNLHSSHTEDRQPGNPAINEYSRPILPITIEGFQGCAIVDSAAKRSLAGHTLYKILRDMGKTFTPSSSTNKYADGESRREDVLFIDLEVMLLDRMIPISFIVLPEATDNETLLGVDFLKKAGIILDFAANSWHFADTPSVKHELQMEGSFMTHMCSHKGIPALDDKITLRADEGTALVNTQRFEVLSVDLFGPLPPGPNNEKWILIVEDVATKWVELFQLVSATSAVCARTLIDEVFLRYGLPRQVISDNGVQFVSEVMQKAMHELGVEQALIPLYHPESNPVERKNRDLKTQLAILVKSNHSKWPEALPSIRFAMNSSVTQSTGRSPAYLSFGREMRSVIEVEHDLRPIVNKTDNFIPQISPYLLKLKEALTDAKETIMSQQDYRKQYADQARRHVLFCEGDKVLLKSHVLSSSSKGISSKFVPKRDGPYEIAKRISPTSYLLRHLGNSDDTFGKYHVSDLVKYHAKDDGVADTPVIRQKKRGRPRKDAVHNSSASAPQPVAKMRGRPRKKTLYQPMSEDATMDCRGSL